MPRVRDLWHWSVYVHSSSGADQCSAVLSYDCEGERDEADMTMH